MKATYNSITGLDKTNEAFGPADAAFREAVERATVDSRRYILSKKQTPGIGYDDRLQVRLGVGRTTIFKLIGAGKLVLIPVEGKVMMSERAIRRFEDGISIVAETQASTSQAA